MTYKNHRLLKQVQEFANLGATTTVYNINGIDINKAIFFYREKDDKYIIFQAAEYQVYQVGNDTFFKINNAAIPAQALTYQVCYPIELDASEYPDSSFLTADQLRKKYNELQKDVEEVFDYLRTQVMGTDDMTVINNLPAVNVGECWIRDANGYVGFDVKGLETRVNNAVNSILAGAAADRQALANALSSFELEFKGRLDRHTIDKINLINSQFTLDVTSFKKELRDKTDELLAELGVVTEDKVGNLAELLTKEKSLIVPAINELVELIGDPFDIPGKTVIEAINQVEEEKGDLGNLYTNTKASLVEALNEIFSDKIGASGGLITGEILRDGVAIDALTDDRTLVDKHYTDATYLSLEGGQVNGELTLADLAPGQETEYHVVNLGYIDKHYVNKAGDTMTGTLFIPDLDTTSQPDAAANKKYVDEAIAAIGTTPGTPGGTDIFQKRMEYDCVNGGQLVFERIGDMVYITGDPVILPNSVGEFLPFDEIDTDFLPVTDEVYIGDYHEDNAHYSVLLIESRQTGSNSVMVRDTNVIDPQGTALNLLYFYNINQDLILPVPSLPPDPKIKYTTANTIEQDRFIKNLYFPYEEVGGTPDINTPDKFYKFINTYLVTRQKTTPTAFLDPLKSIFMKWTLPDLKAEPMTVFAIDLELIPELSGGGHEIISEIIPRVNAGNPNNFIDFDIVFDINGYKQEYRMTAVKKDNLATPTVNINWAYEEYEKEYYTPNKSLFTFSKKGYLVNILGEIVLDIDWNLNPILLNAVPQAFHNVIHPVYFNAYAVNGDVASFVIAGGKITLTGCNTVREQSFTFDHSYSMDIRNRLTHKGSTRVELIEVKNVLLSSVQTKGEYYAHNLVETGDIPPVLVQEWYLKVSEAKDGYLTQEITSYIDNSIWRRTKRGTASNWSVWARLDNTAAINTDNHYKLDRAEETKLTDAGSWYTWLDQKTNNNKNNFSVHIESVSDAFFHTFLNINMGLVRTPEALRDGGILKIYKNDYIPNIIYELVDREGVQRYSGFITATRAVNNSASYYIHFGNGHWDNSCDVVREGRTVTIYGRWYGDGGTSNALIGTMGVEFHSQTRVDPGFTDFNQNSWLRVTGPNANLYLQSSADPQGQKEFSVTYTI